MQNDLIIFFIHAKAIGPYISLLGFVIAFILTVWRHRTGMFVAAVLYGIGALASFGPMAVFYFIGLRTNILLAEGDSGESHGFLLGFTYLLAICMVSYPIGSTVLLWSKISPKTAMRWGKIFHFVLLPLLVLAIALMNGSRVLRGGELGWLVYPLLWFRIRENYIASARSCDSQTQ